VGLPQVEEPVELLELLAVVGDLDNSAEVLVVVRGKRLEQKEVLGSEWMAILGLERLCLHPLCMVSCECVILYVRYLHRKRPVRKHFMLHMICTSPRSLECYIKIQTAEGYKKQNSVLTGTWFYDGNRNAG
jgi:hypothetical protein